MTRKSKHRSCIFVFFHKVRSSTRTSNQRLQKTKNRNYLKKVYEIPSCLIECRF
uniref:Uncharacterized protein n=1 Tax=Arundo donax TaxID=35708 RepID=A0A0A9EWB2_ARUDO